MQNLLIDNPKEEFNNIINDISNNPIVQKMKNYRQHYDTSCFDHCMHVAFYSYLICKKLGLDFEAAARSRYVTRFISL